MDIRGNWQSVLHANHNFQIDPYLDSGGAVYDYFIEKLRPVHQIVGLGADEAEAESPDTMPQTSISDLLGVKVRAPIYKVPVIPYLQTEILHPGSWTMTVDEEDSGPRKR